MKAIPFLCAALLASALLGCMETEVTSPSQTNNTNDQNTDDRNTDEPDNDHPIDSSLLDHLKSGCMLLKEDQMKFGNRLITYYDYNDALQLTHSETLGKDQAVYHSLDYTWDHNGRIESIKGTQNKVPYEVQYTYDGDRYRHATITQGSHQIRIISSMHYVYSDTLWYFPGAGDKPMYMVEFYYTNGNVVLEITHEDYEMDGYFEYTYQNDYSFDNKINPHATFPHHWYPKLNANNEYHAGMEYIYDSKGYPAVYKNGYDSTMYTYLCK